MNQLLEGINAGDLLQRMPSNVRTSVESLMRAGMDWNEVGDLLAATPTAGVALTGTGQWTGDLWQAVKWEFRSFLCTDSESYAELRKTWPELRHRSSALAASSLTTLIAAKLGVASGVIAPLVTWLFVALRRTGEDTLCVMLSTGPGHGSVLPRSSDE